MARRLIKRYAHDWLLHRKLVTCHAEAKHKVQQGHVFFDGIKVVAHLQYPDPDMITISGGYGTVASPSGKAVVKTTPKGTASKYKGHEQLSAAEWLLDSGLCRGVEEAKNLVTFGKVKLDGRMAMSFVTYSRPREIWVED